MIAKSKRSRPGNLFDDPVARRLLILIVCLILGGLLTFIFALVNGVVDITGSARSYNEALVARKKAQYENRSTVDDYQNYILALIESGDFFEANRELARMKTEDFDITRGENILFLEAAIEYAQGNTASAIERYQEVVRLTKAAYIEERDNGSQDQNWAIAYGIHTNYGQSLLMLAAIYQQQGDYEKALEYFNTYLEEFPTQAGVLVDRANLKLQMGDKAGSRADYLAAQEWMPRNAEIEEGLKRTEE